MREKFENASSWRSRAGGEDGIRTHEKLLTSTPLAGERLRPLGPLSVAPLDNEKRQHNQQAGAIIAEKTDPCRTAAFAVWRLAAILGQFPGASKARDSVTRP